MSAPADSPDERPPEKQIPLWMAVALLVALLAGGVGIMWRYLRPPGEKPNVMRAIVPPKNGPRVAERPREPSGGGVTAAEALSAGAEADLPDGAYPRAGYVMFKAGDAYLRAAPGEGGAADELRVGYFTVSEAEWEHGYLTQGVRRILAQPEAEREYEVTAAQRAKLEALPPAPAARWTAEEMAPLAEAYAAWRGSAGGEALAPVTRRVVEALRATAGPRRAAEQARMAERVRAIKGILSEKQIQKINPIPRWDFPADVKRGTGTRPAGGAP